MEFDWSEKQTAFRSDLRAFIERELPDDYEEMKREGLATVRRARVARAFCGKLAAAGMLVRHWPEEYGGDGDEDWWNYLILTEETSGAGEPRGGQYMNVSFVGPAIMKYGTDEQKAEHLERIRSGTVIWCQGFSEPSAGSDLGAMSTRAERIDGGYLINGSKIWTSFAPHADYIFLLARTSTGKRHISCFLLPMDSEGIEVRSHRGVLPWGYLNEVSFTNVFAPESTRLGEEGCAWALVKYVLDYERVGVPVYPQARVVLELVVNQLDADGAFDSPFVQAHAGRVLAALEAARHLSYAVMDERAKGKVPSAIHTMARVANIRAARELIDFLTQHIAAEIDRFDGRVEACYRLAFANSHGGGAHEIVLNTVALQHLGLPRE
jgi:alkylation response protein AidB-like acyl-CoA dehydrogenase